MANPRNIFAYTAPNAGYPEFVSINEVSGVVTLMVRGPKKAPTVNIPYSQPGDTAVMTLPQECLAQLRDALNNELPSAAPPPPARFEARRVLGEGKFIATDDFGKAWLFNTATGDMTRVKQKD